MKITIYELLGLIKEGKQPKYIRFDTEVYSLNPNNHYVRESGDFIQRLDIEYNLVRCLNDEVEIIEEEKEIEKLKIDYECCNECIFKELEEKINELIDVINDMRDKE